MRWIVINFKYIIFYSCSKTGGLFGCEAEVEVLNANKKKKSVLQTYLATRVPGGRVRRETLDQVGEYYIEFRVYNTEQATSCDPDQRWRKAEVTLKAKLDRGTPQWEQLQLFMRRAHELFDDCEPVYYNEK